MQTLGPAVAGYRANRPGAAPMNNVRPSVVATAPDGSACRCGVDAGILDGAPFSAAMACKRHSVRGAAAIDDMTAEAGARSRNGDQELWCAVRSIDLTDAASSMRERELSKLNPGTILPALRWLREAAVRIFQGAADAPQASGSLVLRPLLRCAKPRIIPITESAAFENRRKRLRR